MYTEVPQARQGYLRRYTKLYPRGRALLYTGSRTVPTVEVVLQLKLSAFTCRTDEAIVSDRLNNATLMHSFTHQTDAIKHGPSMHLPAKAKASRHHQVVCAALLFGVLHTNKKGCLCWNRCVLKRRAAGGNTRSEQRHSVIAKSIYPVSGSNR